MRRGLVAAFREIDAVCDAIEGLKKKNFTQFTVYTPTPRHEIEHALKPPISPVRKYTLIGGALGVTFGYWIAIWTSEYWPLVVGGKAVASWIPYTIIGFEVFVLKVDLSTDLVGGRIFRLPAFRRRRCRKRISERSRPNAIIGKRLPRGK